MLKLLEQIPILGDYVVTPVTSSVHLVIDVAQFVLGI